MKTDDCALCGMEEVEHRKLEESGFRRHQFTLNRNELIPVEPKIKKETSPRRVIQITPAPDLALRALLRAKGFLTDEDIMALDKYPESISVGVPDEHDHEVG